MPIYEYQCKKCHHRFERIVKFSDKPLKKCPDCGGPVEQLISAPAVQFKGSGWYVTDYAKKSSGHAESESKPAASDSSSKKDEKPKPVEIDVAAADDGVAVNPDVAVVDDGLDAAAGKIERGAGIDRRAAGVGVVAREAEDAGAVHDQRENVLKTSARNATAAGVAVCPFAG